VIEAAAILRARPRAGPPSFAPRAFALARASRVRTEIIARSFSARAANRCSTNGSTSAPSSATRKGTRCAIRPEMKCTLRLSRSSFATATEQRLRRASARAAASCGRRSRASLPLPVSTSTNSRVSWKPSAAAKRSKVSFWASRPKVLHQIEFQIVVERDIPGIDGGQSSKVIVHAPIFASALVLSGFCDPPERSSSMNSRLV
jgi:hypothetical protein